MGWKCGEEAFSLHLLPGPCQPWTIFPKALPGTAPASPICALGVYGGVPVSVTMFRSSKDWGVGQTQTPCLQDWYFFPTVFAE